MWWFIGIVLWWLSAVIPFLWMSENDWRDLKWGQLLGVTALGMIGPLLAFCILVVFLIQADFWNKPIWPRKKK